MSFMVIRFFKKSYYPQLLAIVLLASAWWLPGALLPGTHSGSGLQDMMPAHPFIWQVAGLLLFLVSAFLINATATRFRLTGRNSSLTAFFFVLVGSAAGFLTQMSNILAASFFFFLFYRKTFALQNNPQVIAGAFDAGLFLGIASLFFPPVLLLLPFVWIALIIYQTSQWRPYFTVIIGVALPWFFVFSGYYWFGRLNQLPPHFIQDFHLRLLENPFPASTDLFMFCFVALITLTAVVWLTGNLARFNISQRQQALTSLWGITFTTLMLFLFQVPVQSLILLAGPSALILGIFFSQIKKLKWANLLVMAWMIFIFFNQYMPFFHAS